MKRAALSVSVVAASCVVAAAVVGTSACCEDVFIRLGRISAYLNGIFELSGEVEIDGYYSVEFSGDLGGWAKIPGFVEEEIETDISTSAFSAAEVRYDVDYDAAKEEISVLRAESAGGTQLFVSWKGDKYTVDKGVCFLGWTEGGEVKLAAAFCKGSTGAMYCYMPGANEEATYCERCSSGGQCEACNMNKSLEACLPPKEVGGSVDIDVDIDIDIDIDVDIGLTEAGA